MKIPVKRLLSLLIVFVLILGMFPTVMAAETHGSADSITEGSGVLPEAWQLISDSLPDAIEGYDPNDPENQYPYGIPVDTFYPEEEDPYGIALMALDQSYIPEEMWDSTILRALEYTGYDVQYLKDNGYLYVRQYTGSNILNYAPNVLSDIGYWESGACPNGDETVADSSTVTGKAPKISYFESNGLVCASFVTYFLCNYLPNIEGVDTSVVYEKAKEMGADSSNGAYYLTSVSLWKRTLDALVSDSGSGVTKYTDEDEAYENLVPGDVIIFSADGDLKHVAIYAGTCDFYSTSGSNGGKYHFIIHVGNSRGPEISTVEYMGSAGAKSSYPTAWYHLEFNDIDDDPGYIEVNKSDSNGKALAGAYFTATNQETGDKYTIGPTNSSGYAKSGELALGTYTVVETVFPDGYEASGTTSWTVTLTKDTPNMTITIDAVNKLITGSLEIQKATNTGKNLSGWSFGVYTDAACTKPIDGSPFTTGTKGTVTVNNLIPGTYYVKELSGSTDFWVTDNDVKTVKVTGNNTTTVTVENTHYGYAEIIKETNTGENLGGWKFNIYTDEACTKLVEGSPFTTDDKGKISVKLLPGTYYIQEVDESTQNPDWVYDTTVKTVTVVAGDTKSVTFTNTQYGKGKIIKSMPDGGSVAGWVFEVYRSSDNALVGTYTTGEDGTITTDYLLPGDYVVKEILDEDSLYWCESDNPQTVTIVAGQTAGVTFTNRLKPGEISIQKVNEKGEPLSGAEFLLEWSADGVTWKPVTYTDSQYVSEGTCTSAGLTNGRLISDENGLVTFTGLHPERLYRLTETAAPDGHQLLTSPAYEGGLSIENELTVTLTVVNCPVYELPKTGSNALLMMQIIGAFGISASIVMTTAYRKRRG